MAEVDPLGSLPSWLLSRAGVRAHRILQRRFDAIGFTGYESRVLAALNAAGPQSQAQIGRAVSLDRRDVTHTVRRLEERGFVERTRHAVDGRLAIIQLTAAGRRAWPRIADAMQQVQDELLADLTAKERTQFVALLERVAGE